MDVTLENNKDTRHRLLEAAGEVFAQKGYDAATVREIVERAGANVASVNYYFGGKEGLYLEVLGFACEAARTPRPEGEPRERLLGFIRHFLTRCLGARHDSWRGLLLAREMAHPSPALQTLVDKLMRPVMDQLISLVRELGPHLDEREAWLSAASIMGQCAHHRHAEAILERLGAPLPAGEERVEILARHILTFSLGGLGAYR